MDNSSFVLQLMMKNHLPIEYIYERPKGGNTTAVYNLSYSYI